MIFQCTSHEFFHLVGHSSAEDDDANYETLKIILREKCISHPPHDESWGEVGYTTTWTERLATEKLIVPSITCYADIPFEALGTHARKYGRFGLALPAGLLTRFGARPVTYIPMRSDDWQSLQGLTLLKDIEAIVKGYYEQIVTNTNPPEEKGRSLGKKPSNPASAIHAVHHLLMKDFLAFIKPYNSELSHNHPDNYYTEREWRKYGNMQFEERQVTRIVVAMGFKSRFQDEFPEYKGRVYELQP